MNSNWFGRLLTAVALAFFATAAQPQSGATSAEGRITNAGKPVAGVQVVLIQQESFKTYKTKTDQDGGYSLTGLARGAYTVEIFGPAGEYLYRKTHQITGDGSSPTRIDIDLAGTASKPAAPSPAPSEAPKQPAAADSGVNALISQYNAALRARDTAAAISALKAIVAADPTRWDYFEALGEAQYNAGDYENSAESFGKGIDAAQRFISAPSAANDIITKSDRDRAKSTMVEMLTNQGNAYLKLKKNSEAIDAYTRSAELGSDPATAYFNLCVLHYNTRTLDGAAAACDKAIAANPTRADAYFIKGALLFSDGKQDKNGKVLAPPGTVEALKKYLALAPQGPYAAQVRQMLDYIAPGSPSSAAPGQKP